MNPVTSSLLNGNDPVGNYINTLNPTTGALLNPNLSPDDQLLAYQNPTTATELAHKEYLDQASQQGQDAMNQFKSAQTAIAQSQEHKSFWQKILPTAGGILGGIAGAALAPETGGLSLAIPALIAGEGGGAGKAIENVTEGKPVGSGVAGDVLSNVTGGVAGGILGKGVGAVTGKVIPKVADKIGQGMFQGQFDKALSADAAQSLYKMGVRTDKELGQIAPVITGANGVYPEAIKQGLASAEDAGHVVDLTGIDTSARDALAGSLGVKPNTLNQVGKTITDAINESTRGDVTMVPGIRGAPPTFAYAQGSLANANPTTVFEQVKKLQGLAQGARQKAYDNFGNVINPEQEAIYKSLNSVSKDMEERVFGSSGAQIPLSDEAKQAITEKLSPIKSINPKVYDNLVKNLPDNLQGLRSPQAPFVQGSKAIQAMGRAQDRSGGLQAGDLAKVIFAPALAIGGGTVLGPLGMAAGALPLITSSNVFERGGSQVASKMADLLSRIPEATYPAAGRIMGSITSNAPNDASGNVPLNGNINGGTTMSPAQSTQMGMNPNSILGTLSNADIAAIQMGLHNMALDPYGQNPGYAQALGAGITGLQNILPATQGIMGAQAALGGAEQAFGAAGGGQGLIPGLLAKLGGKITGGPAATYGAQRQQLAQQLEKYGVPASAVPDITQTGPAAEQQFSTLQGIIAALGGGSPVPAQ